MNRNRLVVIGAGAAGFFCALKAAAVNPGLQVVIVEKSSKVLSKVKVSGGGRCNVTHDSESIATMVKNYPRGDKFLKKAFPHFFVNDTVSWFKERNISLKTEEDGRMFPVTDSSQTIIDCFTDSARKYNIELLLNKDVKAIKLESGVWTITFNDASTLKAEFIAVACGGFPKISQFGWLAAAGHSIETPVPSLFTFNITAHPLKHLMGISREEVSVKIAGTKFTQNGPLLITHWGFSGPAILKLSAFAARELYNANYDFNIQVNWLPQFTEQTLLENFSALRKLLGSQKVINRNPFSFPQRLWEYFMETAAISDEIRWASLPAKQQNVLVKILCTQTFQVKGKTTFKDEFVTAGGVRLNEIEPTTMKSRIKPRLYFCGEVMDVDGITGGFNFQHAWTSGWLAGKAIGEETRAMETNASTSELTGTELSSKG